MAALAAESTVQINIYGWFEGKLSVRLESTVAKLKEDIAAAAAAMVIAADEDLDPDFFELELHFEGAVLDDAARLSTSGVKKSSRVEVIWLNLRKNASSASSMP